jgi:hypothetical protein
MNLTWRQFQRSILPDSEMLFMRCNLGVQYHYTLHVRVYLYEHVVTGMIDFRRGFDWQPYLFDSYCSLLHVTITVQGSTQSTIHYGTQVSLLSLLCLHKSSGNGFQRRTFPFLWVAELSPCQKSKLPTVSRSVCPGVTPHSGLVTNYSFF